MMPVLSEENVAVYAVSYDDQETLHRFASAKGITYSLLSDVGSVAISDLGLRNDQVRDHHDFYGVKWNPEHLGVPYAGAFVLDRTGMVVDKRFQQSYRTRETGAGIVARALDIATPPAVTTVLQAESIKVRVSLDAAEFRFHQQLWLAVDLELATGWHCYAEPVPVGFTAVRVDLEPVAGIEIGAVEWPEPSSFRMVGSNEEFFGYEGTTTALVPLTFAVRDVGQIELQGSVSLQVCSATECLPPASVEWSFVLPEAAHAARAT